LEPTSELGELASRGPARKVERGRLVQLLDAVERAGNQLPHPAIVFAILIGVVIALSHVFYLMGASATFAAIDPEAHALERTTVAARSLLTSEGLRFLFENVVQNFMRFESVGVIMVAMLGVGVADASGLVRALSRRLAMLAPKKALTYILVFVWIVSSSAADAGYLVLVPLAASVFTSVGRNPLAGLAASFAGVASVFSVNILTKPLDGILTGITNDAIHLLDPSRSIGLTANLWFSIASVILLTVAVTLITEKVVEPRLGHYPATAEAAGDSELSEKEPRGLRCAFFALLGVAALFALLTVPTGAPLRNPETGTVIGNSPFMNGLIVAVTISFFVTGLAYGIGARTIETGTDVAGAMEKGLSGLAGLMVLLFLMSQFLACFEYSNLATLAAAKLGDRLELAGFGALPLLIAFVFLVGALDLVLTGALAKWVILAPVFVPQLMRLNVAPEAVLVAYRVGDSSMNAITPLNAYFALIVTFAPRYQKGAGVGTVVALLLPYAVIVFALWTALLAVWQIFGLPWGLG
jgi:aminobenzoyl-glutamate transport protein